MGNGMNPPTCCWVGDLTLGRLSFPPQDTIRVRAYLEVKSISKRWLRSLKQTTGVGGKQSANLKTRILNSAIEGLGATPVEGRCHSAPRRLH